MVGNGVRHSLVVMQICESRVLELAGGGGVVEAGSWGEYPLCRYDEHWSLVLDAALP